MSEQTDCHGWAEGRKVKRACMALPLSLWLHPTQTTPISHLALACFSGNCTQDLLLDTKWGRHQVGQHLERPESLLVVITYLNAVDRRLQVKFDFHAIQVYPRGRQDFCKITCTVPSLQPTFWGFPTARNLSSPRLWNSWIGKRLASLPTEQSLLWQTKQAGGALICLLRTFTSAVSSRAQPSRPWGLSGAGKAARSDAAMTTVQGLQGDSFPGHAELVLRPAKISPSSRKTVSILLNTSVPIRPPDRMKIPHFHLQWVSKCGFS